MLRFRNVDIFGFAAAMRGMRNPKRDKDHPNLNDGHHCWEYDECDDCPAYDLEKGVCHNMIGYHSDDDYVIGPNDLVLALRLNHGGPEHSKYRRMIPVWVDITGPLYWWKEFDTYKIGTVANSTSTMHMIMASEITMDDFSTDGMSSSAKERLEYTIIELNGYRNGYLDCEAWLKEHEESKYDGPEKDGWRMLKDQYWRDMILRLPTNYNQTRTVCLNYETLANIYKQRAWHKLTEWKVDFIEFIKKLPYQELITGVDLDGNKIL